MQSWLEQDLIGGHPALDFLNTVSDVGKTRRETRLATWDDYLAWLNAAKIAPVEGLADVSEENRPAVLSEIHDLRETAYSVLHVLASGAVADRDALAKLQDVIKRALHHATLYPTDVGLRWTVLRDDPKAHVHRLALLIEDFLRAEEVCRLRECGRCTWLFIDKGRGRGRRWCDMGTCGNRAKVESFRAKRSRDASPGQA